MEERPGALEGVALSPTGPDTAFGGAYQGRRVLLTGHTGFKGSWLSIWLNRMGAEVSGLALAPDTTPSLFSLAGLETAIHQHTICDIRDYPALLATVQAARPEIIFHLAAQPLVRRSYREPRETIDTNVTGTANLLEAARQTESTRAVVVVTTDKCYENKEWHWGYRENDRLGGHDPYSASKACAELVAGAYRSSFFEVDPVVGLATARAGNVIGGGDWAEDRIIPDAIRAAEDGVPLEVRNPQAVRPWQHVLEPLSGYLTLGACLLQEPGKYSQAFNFGPAADDVVRVEHLVSRFIEVYGQGSWISTAEKGAAEPHEAGLLRLACEKANRVLGWREVLSADQALELTASWYRGVLRGGADAAKACQSDIDTFCEEAQKQGKGQ